MTQVASGAWIAGLQVTGSVSNVNHSTADSRRGTQVSDITEEIGRRCPLLPCITVLCRFGPTLALDRARHRSPVQVPPARSIGLVPVWLSLERVRAHSTPIGNPRKTSPTNGPTENPTRPVSAQSPFNARSSAPGRGHRAARQSRRPGNPRPARLAATRTRNPSQNSPGGSGRPKRSCSREATLPRARHPDPSRGHIRSRA